MKLTVIGCSDAFGSGGRLQTTFHVETAAGGLLIDCGATALIGLEREGIDPNGISTICISHLHGDHFAGLVWWLIHAIHVAKRTAPLTVTGPEGLEARFTAAAEALFPGATTTPRAFDLQFLSYRDEAPLTVNGVRVTAFEVRHPSGATPYGLRIEADGRRIGFSGDTEWVENLVQVADGADLYITECYAFASEARYHLNWRTIEKELPRLKARRILLTHMGHDMLANRAAVSVAHVMLAEDGLTLEV